MVANTEAEVSQRPVSGTLSLFSLTRSGVVQARTMHFQAGLTETGFAGEPMSVIANLGLSTSFTTISTSLVYPATMRIVRFSLI